MSTCAVFCEIQRTWQRPDAEQYAELYAAYAPNYRAWIAPGCNPGNRPASAGSGSSRARGRPPSVTKAFHADQALFDVLAAYRNSTRPRPQESEVMRTALEEFLAARGFWPWPPAEQSK
jgi:hypothetical protein